MAGPGLLPHQRADANWACGLWPVDAQAGPLGLTSHDRLILGYSCLRCRRRLLDMAEVNRRRLLE